MDYEDEEDFDIETSLEALPAYPVDVQETIDSVLSSSDPLDKPDFNVVEYINTLFPTEQSLSNIDNVIDGIQKKIRHLDSDIRTVVRGQQNVAEEGREALEEAQQSIQQLFSKVIDIKEKAEKSEQMVKEITRDIKQLDYAKRHLTNSITTLNHLHMLLGDVQSLESLIRQRQYNEVATLLERVKNILGHFNRYMDIPQVEELATRVNKLEDGVGNQILLDFKEEFEGPQARHGHINIRMLSDACLVISVLPPKFFNQLVEGFIRQQLSEYVVLFEKNQDVAWLDNIDKRFTWIKKTLVQFEQKFDKLFPDEFEMSERIAVEFCHITRDELGKVMQRRVHELDVKLLLNAIQKTAAFEDLLNKRFTGVTLSETEKPEMNPFANSSQDPTSAVPSDEADAENEPTSGTDEPFCRIISQCFEPHLGIYIEAQNRNLAEVISRFVSEYKQQIQSTQSSGVPALPQTGAGTENSSSQVLSSSSDLFYFYKRCMKQCSQLSTGAPMLRLCAVFQKYLREYADKVLLSGLPKLSPVSSSAAVPNLPANILNLMQLREGDSVVKLSEDELYRVCSILCTAEYCLETTQQLQDKLKEKVDSDLVPQVNLSTEQDTFHSVISQCILVLVQNLESACEPALTAMTKLPWQTLDLVGDQSNYVTAISTHLRQTVPCIRAGLLSSMKFFTQFCVKFASSFIPKFVNHLYQCKPLGRVAVEQLLLDTSSLKTLLIDFPSLGSKIARKAPASYTKIVNKGMNRADMILKIVYMSLDEPTPARSYVDNYVKMLPESDAGEFKRILEMRGVKRNEQVLLIEQYLKMAPPYVGPTATGASPAMHTQQTGNPGVEPTASASSTDQDVGRIRKLEKLIKKRL